MSEAFDAVPRQGKTHLKGRKIDLSVLQCCSFLPHTGQSRLYYGFAAFFLSACVLADVEKAVFIACFKVRMQI